MKKFYNTPEMMMTYTHTSDIITNSGTLGFKDSGDGDVDNWDEI